MRSLVLALSVLAALAWVRGMASAQVADGQNVVRARGLDQQGVRAFREGRYRDAIRFFNEAYRLGGPSSEIWNVVRCYQRLDQPEDAARALARYLEQPDLRPSERAEAVHELQELQRRPSQTSFDTDPIGATVILDGRPAPSTTPLESDIPPGPHRIRIERAGYRPYEANIDARFGRAILVSVKLAPTGSGEESVATHPSESEGGGTMATSGPARRFLFSAEAGLFVPRLGSIQGSARPAVHLAVRYVWNPESRVLLTTGLRATALTYGGSSPAPLCQMANGESSAEIGGLVTGGFAVRAFPRVRIGAEIGVGAAGMAGGGSNTEASADCPTSRGLAVLGHAGLEASIALSSGLRLILSPVTFQAHPAFRGAREIPPSTVDASGLWWRVGSSMGFAFDAK